MYFMISVTIVYSWASISRKRKSWTMAKVKPNVVSFFKSFDIVDGLNNEINKSLSQINNNNKHHVFTRALYE